MASVGRDPLLVTFRGRQVVQPHDVLVKRQQFFDQVRSDEAGGAGDEPGFGSGDEGRFYFIVGGHLGEKLRTETLKTEIGH